MVKELAFLFPGQGSQYVGMGKQAFESSQAAKKLLEKADAIAGFPLVKTMLEGPEEKLKETTVTQPALFLASAAAFEQLKERGISPAFAAGHSLGEYSALFAAGVLDFDDALKLVCARGKAMQEAGAKNKGTMAAVLGLKQEQVEEICRSIPEDLGPCVAANINSATQIVISGSEAAVKKGVEEAQKAGALKVVPLNVSGAFHSPLMSSAVEQLKPVLDSIQFKPARFPVITNVDATPTTEPADFKRKLADQITSGVRWHQSAQWLTSQEVDTFIEVGAGRVLSTLMKKLDRKKTTFFTDDFESLVTKLGEQHAIKG